LLEPLRQFAHARLAESGELPAARRRQAEYVLALAERASKDAERRGVFQDGQSLNPEADNIRLALTWAVESVDVELALRLGAALWMWWTRPDRQAQGRAWLERILALPDTLAEPVLRARVMVGLAFLSVQHGYVAEGARLADEVRQLARAADDTGLDAVAASVLGAAVAFLGDAGRAESLVRESVALARTAGVRWIEVLGVAALAILALHRGDLNTAETCLAESLCLAREGLDPWSRATVQSCLAEFLRARGDLAGAGEAYEQALALFSSLDPHRHYAPQGLLHNLGYLALARGEARRAASLFVESAEIYRTVGTDRHGLAECLIGLACVAVRRRQTRLAARLFGVAEAELERLGTGLTPANRAEYQRGRAALAAARPTERLIAAAAAEGRGLSLDDALDQARGLVRPRHSVGRNAREAGQRLG
jgi:ATP/maltotriose-dependent transcriptional regulator MalT